jgi:hypothetical protein
MVSGGYTDPDGATWVDFAATHYVVAVRLIGMDSVAPVDELGPNRVERPFAIPIRGEVGFGGATIAGNQLFVATASTDVNDLASGAGGGTLHRIDLLSGAVLGTVALTSAAAASADVTANGDAFVSGTETVVRSSSPGFDPTGRSVEQESSASGSRKLWLRVE